MDIRLKRLKPIKFDWDKGNKEKNWVKHKVKFYECEHPFFNTPHKIFIDNKYKGKEKRFVILGKTNRKRYLFIVFTIRNKLIRIISARDMNKNERKFYEKE